MKPEVFTMELPAEGDCPARFVGEVVVNAGEDDEKQLWESEFFATAEAARMAAHKWLKENCK